MELTLETIRAAHARIAPYIVQTPLLRLPALDDALGCEVYAKAECMQRTGAFKLRGAMNKILALTEDERARGFVAASSGNHGRAVAYAAQRFGTHACIVMPETAPAVKQAAIRALGAELVLCDAAERFDVAARICAERGATMVPPFNDPLVMAGQGTVGLEILEQCPALDALVVPVSGGGLIGGVATAVKALAPHVRVYGAEPEALPRYRESLRAGHPVRVEQQRSVADALVAQKPGDVCFPYVAENTDGIVTVNGHSYRDPKLHSNNTNFALLVSNTFTEPFTEPHQYGKRIASFSNMLGGGVLLQRFGDLINGRRTNERRLKKSFTKPTLNATPGDLSLVLPKRQLDDIIEMIYALDKIAPGMANADTLLYGVEVKFYSARLELDGKLETKIHNLFACGDGAGITRGLSQASASGVHVARQIGERARSGK